MTAIESAGVSVGQLVCRSVLIIVAASWPLQWRGVGGANGNSEQWRTYYTIHHEPTSAIIPLLLIVLHEMQVRNIAIKKTTLYN